MQKSPSELKLIHAKEWIKTYLQRVPWLYQIVMRWKARQHPVLARTRRVHPNRH
jgi:hypothetical protein